MKKHATGRDITKVSELFEADEKLKIANLAIFNQKMALDSAAIVAETDTRGRITYANEKFLEISKYSKLEIIGQNHRILESGYHSKEFFTNLWKTISSGTVWRGEIRNKAKDGSHYWVDTTIYPVRDENAELKGYVAIRFDITEKKALLLKIESAREAAVIADQAKTQFLYTMSHEIRTPLNGIIGMISLLQETELTADQREYSETISRSGTTLLTIINDILDFSKIEAGKMDLEEVEFDVKCYLSELIKPFQHTAQKKDISLKFECMDYPNAIVGDDGKMGQIVSNLVSNAMKFTKKGGVIIRVDCKDRDDKTAVTISVHDSGMGIPKEAQARMFQAFSQAEKTTSRNYGGTGLGLSISKRLVELMQGKISFESELGKGTTFKVELLLRKGKELTLMQNQVQCQGQLQNQIQKITGRILVAEDNSTNQLVLSRMLDKWGCKYHMVGNGNEVIDAMREGKFDLILMDCQMPEMDGYQATRNIRNSQSLDQEIPIVALTANVVQGDQQKCQEAGMNEYLSKPIDRTALKSVLLKYLAAEEKVTSLPMIDRNILAQLEDLDEDGQDAVVDFIDSFLYNGQKRIETLIHCIQSNDVIGAAREAHNLKSSAQTLGAKKLGTICQELEDYKDSCEFRTISQIFKDLCEIYELSCAELIEIKRQRVEAVARKVA